MTVAVLDSGGANIASVLHALRRLGCEPVFTKDQSIVRKADRIILPGVGAAAQAMITLREHGLAGLIPTLSQPVLGICLGMQLLFESSEEGDTRMLGVIPGRVRRFPDSRTLRVPHMGWNQCSFIQNHYMNDGSQGNWFYFVHSYYAPVSDKTIATTEHGTAVSAIVQLDNFMGAQFHPERSAQAGSNLLRRFLEYTD